MQILIVLASFVFESARGQNDPPGPLGAKTGSNNATCSKQLCANELIHELLL